MDSQGKAKVALTFALYQGDQLVRRDTIAQDIVKVGKDPRSHLRVDDELASRMHAVIEVASSRRHHAHRSRQRAGHAGERPARQQVQDPPGRSDPDRLDAHRARERAEPADAAAPAPAPLRRAAARHPPRVRRRGTPRAAAAEPLRAVRCGARAGRIRSRPANPFAALRPRRRIRSRGAPIRSRCGAAIAARDAARADVGLGIERAAEAATRHLLDGQERPGRQPRRGRGRAPSAIEVMVLWDTNVLHVSHLAPPPLVLRRRRERRQAACDYFIPSETLGTTRAPIVIARARRVARHPSALATGYVDIPGQGKVSSQISSRRGARVRRAR